MIIGILFTLSQIFCWAYFKRISTPADSSQLENFYEAKNENSDQDNNLFKRSFDKFKKDWN